jgi:carboxylesterase type B
LRLAIELECVIVTPNYRLGTLGFLVALDVDPTLTGNYAIGDCLTSLEFIRPILASFGGDQDRITVMGQSSGGTNIFAMLAAPRAHGLFNSAIVLSGSPNITADVNTTSNLHQKYLLPLTGCEDLDCLLSRSAHNLTAASAALNGRSTVPGFNPPLLPVSPEGNQLIALVGKS